MSLSALLDRRVENSWRSFFYRVTNDLGFVDEEAAQPILSKFFWSRDDTVGSNPSVRVGGTRGHRKRVVHLSAAGELFVDDIGAQSLAQLG